LPRTREAKMLAKQRAAKTRKAACMDFKKRAGCWSATGRGPT